ncbi:hypothetical protein F5Y15DRAFT_376943 [Xylariaceae sp. FL0016]|nr:hypothetical protein F5Y15DRAFT_376943 [Xylariaceae sp. FL0016]
MKTVQGSLDNSSLIEREASQADIILHLAHTKHLKSAEAINKGLSQRDVSNPVYWVQMSGASLLAAGELASPSFTPGSASSNVYDDIADAAKIRDLIRGTPTRVVENYVLNVAEGNTGIKTALIFQPIIYGKGEGPVNQRSIQIPAIAKDTLQRGKGVRVGECLSIWGDVHIKDIGKLVSKLAEEATKKQARDEVWSGQGLYLTDVGEMTFGDIAQKIVDAAAQQGHIKADTGVEALVGPDADSVLLPASSVLFGSNCRSRARRAREFLQWEPQGESLVAEIPRAVAEEAASLK